MGELIVSIIAAIIAGISIIISVVSARTSVKQNQKLHEIDMKAHYYSDVFDEYLLKKIPLARQYLRFNGEVLVDGQNFADTLSDMLKAALYFKYDHAVFYEELKEKTQNLEDYILQTGNKKINAADHGDIYKEIQTKLEDIYKCINKYYVGGEN